MYFTLHMPHPLHQITTDQFRTDDIRQKINARDVKVMIRLEEVHDYVPLTFERVVSYVAQTIDPQDLISVKTHERCKQQDCRNKEETFAIVTVNNSHPSLGAVIGTFQKQFGFWTKCSQ